MISPATIPTAQNPSKCLVVAKLSVYQTTQRFLLYLPPSAKKSGLWRRRLSLLQVPLNSCWSYSKSCCGRPAHSATLATVPTKSTNISEESTTSICFSIQRGKYNPDKLRMYGIYRVPQHTHNRPQLRRTRRVAFERRKATSMQPYFESRDTPQAERHKART